MIARKYRLKRWKVNKLLKRPESKKIGLFIVKTYPNKELYYKWALTLSRKFSKKAVDRVRKRRQIYEAIRLIQQEKEEVEGKQYFDVALIPLKQILSADYDTIHQNILDIFNYLDKLKS